MANNGDYWEDLLFGTPPPTKPKPRYTIAWSPRDFPWPLTEMDDYPTLMQASKNAKANAALHFDRQYFVLDSEGSKLRGYVAEIKLVKESGWPGGTTRILDHVRAF